MKAEKILQAFKRDVANHTMRIHKDDGLYRHIEFSSNGNFDCRFFLITWPGYLSIVGDCGDFVFQRTHDMFGFFRREELVINPAYWQEKLCAGASHSGGKSISEDFSFDKYKARVGEWFNDRFPKGEGDRAARKEAWEEVKEQLLEIDADEYSAVAAIREFDSDHINFYDFWESDCTEWNHHYIWCLYAIVWGIQEYDRITSKEIKEA
jgi:hypothetical protein